MLICSVLETKLMAIMKAGASFYQLENLKNIEPVKEIYKRHKKDSNRRLFYNWLRYRSRLKLADNTDSDDQKMMKLEDAIEVSVTKDLLNERISTNESKISEDAIMLPDRELYENTKLISPEEAERFRVVRNLYLRLKSFINRFGSRSMESNEYRYSYESAKAEYVSLRRSLRLNFLNHVMHPWDSSGEYPQMVDCEILRDREKGRKHILGVKGRILKKLRGYKSPASSEMIDDLKELERVLRYQNIQSKNVVEDSFLVAGATLEVFGDVDVSDQRAIEPVVRSLREYLKRNHS